MATKFPTHPQTDGPIVYLRSRRLRKPRFLIKRSPPPPRGAPPALLARAESVTKSKELRGRDVRIDGLGVSLNDERRGWHYLERGQVISMECSSDFRIGTREFYKGPLKWRRVRCGNPYEVAEIEIAPGRPPVRDDSE